MSGQQPAPWNHPLQVTSHTGHTWGQLSVSGLGRGPTLKTEASSFRTADPSQGEAKAKKASGQAGPHSQGCQETPQNRTCSEEVAPPAPQGGLVVFTGSTEHPTCQSSHLTK